MSAAETMQQSPLHAASEEPRPDADAIGFAVVPAASLGLFAIDTDALDRWVGEKGEDELECDLPDRSQEYPARALSDLVNEAQEAGAISSDPRITLVVYENDDSEQSGYHVAVRNTTGPQFMLGLTSGWNELAWLTAETTPRAGALEYLQEVCDEANHVLAMARAVDAEKTGLSARGAMLALQAVMSAREWSSDTFDDIAMVMEAAGYHLADPNID